MFRRRKKMKRKHKKLMNDLEDDVFKFIDNEFDKERAPIMSVGVFIGKCDDGFCP